MTFHNMRAFRRVDPATLEAGRTFDAARVTAACGRTPSRARSSAIVRAVTLADIITAGVPPPGIAFAPTR